MNTLQQICAKKTEHIAYKKSLRSLADLQYLTAEQPLPCGFLGKMKRSKDIALIAEVKKASPSKGIIREDFDPVSIARIYKESGASCLSVLTDEPYFQGHDDFLVSIKKSVDIPVLRKDFIIDPYQVFESRALGADCILLIIAALDDVMARELYETAVGLGMDILVEVHDLEELERSFKLNPMMIGVNNRNLKTLEVDVSTSLQLSLNIPDTTYKISESGIGTNDMITKLKSVGYQGFLVGESLMREDDIQGAVHKLLGK
ncbi:MAG: indole-3-glycerol-phosphate synthase [Zetaproteobacteria bacterium]|nr:MAG: indole-3-glycerol-phosphate synthase [Zetaproteobacteria bacterium]